MRGRKFLQRWPKLVRCSCGRLRNWRVTAGTQGCTPPRQPVPDCRVQLFGSARTCCSSALSQYVSMAIVCNHGLGQLGQQHLQQAVRT